jgi:SAM-dependent methyltransferase
MNATHHIDPVWEDDIYSKGSMRTRYPYDTVISFVHRMRPRTRSIAETSIVEVGCGSANNLWFAAREGFQVSGIDGSTSAIQYANERFKTEGLTGDLRVGDFTTLPWADESHDLAIDRGALVCVSYAGAKCAVDEIWRVLRPGGRFFLNVYGDSSSSARSGTPLPDGRRIDITAGGLNGVGGLCFYGRSDWEALLRGKPWRVLHVDHVVTDDMTSALVSRIADWRIIAEKAAT